MKAIAEPPKPCRGRLVDEPGAAVAQRRQRGGDVVDAVGDVVDAFAVAVEEPADRGVGRGVGSSSWTQEKPPGASATWSIASWTPWPSLVSRPSTVSPNVAV